MAAQMSTTTPGSDPAPEPLPMAAIRGHCPRCRAPSLFAGVLRFAPACRACGLDFSQCNVGDGPAAFLTLVIGAIMVAMALALELTLHPPLWVHVLLWTPVTIGSVVGSLRVAKGMLLILELRNKAGEGRIARGSEAS